MEYAVLVRGLTRRYGDLVAVDRLDLEVREGECLGLLGPNGAGKTTTIETILGLQSPTEGDVLVLGRCWGVNDALLRARIGVSLQETRFPERLTVLEVATLFRSFYPKGRSPREVVEEVGLLEKKGTWTSRLSGGQRQRLALACALVGDPEILVLDEPTTGLDPQARLRVGEMIRAYRESGRTVLVTTHNMEEAERLCDRVAVIDRGRAIVVGAPRELIASLGGAIMIETEFDGSAVEEEALRALPGVRSVKRANGAFLLSASEAHVTVPALLDLARNRGFALSRLTIRNATLEDVYVTLTGRHLRDV